MRWRGNETWRSLVVAASSFAVVMILVGCDSSPADEKGGVVVTVNGSPITREDIRAVMLTKSGAGRLSAEEGGVVRALVEELVERQLILQHARLDGGFVEEARFKALIQVIAGQYGSAEELDKFLVDEGIDKEKWEKAVRETLEMEQVLEKEMYSKIKVLENEARMYYEQNKGGFRLSKRWRVRQIVVATKEEARRLRARIISGVPFVRVARNSSIGLESDKGGDMGLFSLGQLPEDVEGVVRHLKEGELSGVISTSSGFHVFQVTERRSGGVPPYGAVRDEIYTRLQVEKGRESLKQLLSDLRSKANIRYYWRNLNDRAAG